MFKTDYAYKIYVPTEVDLYLGSRIRGLLLNYFQGYTRYSALGGWENGSETYKEDVKVYEVLTSSDDKALKEIQSIVAFIMASSDEESILYTKSPIEMHFVERKTNV